MEHTFETHENCHLTSCMICDGGLGLCKVCGCLEGQLATECPGFDIGSEVGDLIWKGKADFINGEWIFDSEETKHIFPEIRREGYETGWINRSKLKGEES